MSKTGTDGRREPPQTAVVILTALPLACAALAYAWLGTPLPRWLAHLPWRKILQALPPLALGATCIPTLRLMRVAYHGLIHWRLTIGETFRAWLAGALGLILCGLLPLGTLDAFIHGQWITAITGMLMLVMIPICARIIRLYTEATDTVKSDWPRRLLFRRHQLLLERLERSKRGVLMKTKALTNPTGAGGSITVDWNCHARWICTRNGLKRTNPTSRHTLPTTPFCS